MRLRFKCNVDLSNELPRVYFPSPYRGVWDGARVLGRTSLLATNLVWLLWAVWGGFFITKIILSNWLAITIKPVFDKPVDTAEVGRGQREVNG